MGKIDLLVIIRPRYDAGLRYLIKSADELVSYARAEEISFIDINSREVAREHVESIIKNNAHRKTALVFYGHDCFDGGGRGFRGSSRHYVLDTDNIHLAKGLTIFANTCNCAKNHGKKAIVAGARFYSGYRANLFVPTHKSLLAGYYEMINAAFHGTMANGASARNARRIAISEYTKWIEYWNERDELYAALLYANRAAFRSFDERSMKSVLTKGTREERKTKCKSVEQRKCQKTL